MVEGGAGPGFATFIVASKLKYIKEKLKIWNGEIFRDIKIQKAQAFGIDKFS